jgi:hypothetical protein
MCAPIGPLPFGEGGAGAGGGGLPPGVLAIWIARAPAVQMGGDARRSSANVRHPAIAQVLYGAAIRA